MTPVVVDEIRCVRLQTEQVEVRVTAVLAALDVVGSGAVVVVDVDVARVAGALAADGVQPNDLTAPPRPRCAQPRRESQTRVRQNEKGTHATRPLPRKPKPTTETVACELTRHNKSQTCEQRTD